MPVVRPTKTTSSAQLIWTRISSTFSKLSYHLTPSLSGGTRGINSYHSPSSTLLWNTSFHQITSGYITLNSTGKMTLPEPRESKMKFY